MNTGFIRYVRPCSGLVNVGDEGLVGIADESGPRLLAAFASSAIIFFRTS